MQGSFSEAALEQFAQLAAQTQPENFAEGDAYDFTRCVRANGSAYGTRGKCRKGTESAKELVAKGTVAPVAPVPPKSAMTKKDPVASVLKSQQELRAFNKKENERLAELVKAGKVKGVTSADLDRIKANRAGSTAKKATSVELKAAWKDTQGAVKSAAAEAKRVASETKGDKSPEARAKRLAAGAALDKAENAAFRASEKFFAAAKRESRAAMTPEQRKLEREADKLTKGG
jgi:hypothetical protein